MTDTKPKQQRKSKLELREPAKPLAPPVARPLAPDHPAMQIFTQAQAAESPLPEHPPPTTSYHLPPPTSAAPKRDFAKVANSINRDALPSGLFKGTSKKLYDALYQRTRGAIAPTREIQARQGDLMAWAGISHNTLRSHLRHLESVGLVTRKWELGDNDGAVYEVFIPEELGPPTTSYHHLLPPPTSEQKLAGGSNQNLLVGGGGQVSEQSTTSGSPNTLIKTSLRTDDDDDPLAGLRDALYKAAGAVTGRPPTATERDRWRELGEVLATELRMAAARTPSVSSAPSFFAEHLRRRLWKKDKAQMDAAAEEGSGAAEPERPVDASKCPDCNGTGFYYPEGYEGGVSKCRHDKLTRQE